MNAQVLVLHILLLVIQCDRIACARGRLSHSKEGFEKGLLREGAGKGLSILPAQYGIVAKQKLPKPKTKWSKQQTTRCEQRPSNHLLFRPQESSLW